MTLKPPADNCLEKQRRDRGRDAGRLRRQLFGVTFTEGDVFHLEMAEVVGAFFQTEGLEGTDCQLPHVENGTVYVENDRELVVGMTPVDSLVV